ncbi:BNR Asp-box repeat [Micractinium conductrix]|uniref:BNR Asp-box repeat n=1 Tax=Micractinium conductrix TaxID=554055 RepID=A0A2P6VN78_9CHLO|nr:BNR Asp-box repeat [Micractinium conductrix]|eukprot:PSC75556.1 BNR Asp-box repeat [Micractinium conductrix]
MGTGASKADGSPLAELKAGWVLQYESSPVKYASASSLVVIKQADGGKVLALAFQASEAAHEGDRTQHLRLMLSRDAGETWSESKAVMWGAVPLWNPALHYDAATSRLFLFYSESRKSLSPGGDIKYIVSSDLGDSWTEPVVIYSHEAEGEVPKVSSSRVLAANDGSWYLPVHREPAESWHTFSGSVFHPLSEVPEQTLAPPPGAGPQSMTTAASVLVSSDRGATWTARGEIEDAKSWLVNPTLEEGTKGQLVMLFRTAAGKTYMSSSTDKGATWTRPSASYLPNPNSPFSTVTIDGQVLCVFNNSQTQRAPLALALSVNDCKSWEPLAIIEEDPKGNFACPSIVEWAEDTVKVVYTSWGAGLKLATVKLATVDAA